MSKEVQMSIKMEPAKAYQVKQVRALILKYKLAR